MHPENPQSPSQLEVHSSQFFAVCFPKGTDTDPEPSVFTDRQEALRLLKQYKGARFKAFPSLDEANRFASRTPESTSSEDPPSDVTSTGEKPSPFRAPKPQELVKLRKTIENGEADAFRQLVWSNPRYLVSSGDTPTILQEGFRYNALHVAAKANRPELARLTLSAVEDPAFMQLLYPDDSKTSQQQRIAFLVDLYLNTPDKGMCETPLHFASKYGAAAVVKVLTSSPTCEREKKNKYEQTPVELACTRSGPDEHLQDEIRSYLQDQFFIPILRTDDDSSAPIVGEPWSPQKQDPSEPSPYVHQKQIEKPYSVSAYAGPMTPNQASEFHKLLKTPRHLKRTGSPGPNVIDPDDVRLSDYEKGLERIARQLAARMNVRWQERWNFLETYSDLSQPEGLRLLENHLEHRSDERRRASAERDSEGLSDGSFVTASDLDYDHDFSYTSSGLTSLCQAFQNFHLEDNGDASWLVGSPEPKYPDALRPTYVGVRNHNASFDSADAMLHYMHRTCEVVANQIVMELTKLSEMPSRSLKRLRESFLHPAKVLHDIVADVQRCGLPVTLDLDRVHSGVASRVTNSLSQEDNEAARAYLDDVQDPLLRDSQDSTDTSDEDTEPVRWNVTRAKKRLFPSVVEEHADCLLRALSRNDVDRCECHWSVEDATESPSDDSLTKCDVRDDDTTTTGGYLTPPSNLSDFDEDDSEDVFITGQEPTKTDLDILRAMEHADVDAVKFPRVHHWKRLVKSFPLRIAESWPSPSIKKFHRERSPRSSSPRRFPHDDDDVRSSPLNF